MALTGQPPRSRGRAAPNQKWSFRSGLAGTECWLGNLAVSSDPPRAQNRHTGPSSGRALADHAALRKGEGGGNIYKSLDLALHHRLLRARRATASPRARLAQPKSIPSRHARAPGWAPVTTSCATVQSTRQRRQTAVLVPESRAAPPPSSPLIGRTRFSDRAYHAASPCPQPRPPLQICAVSFSVLSVPTGIGCPPPLSSDPVQLHRRIKNLNRLSLLPVVREKWRKVNKNLRYGARAAAGPPAVAHHSLSPPCPLPGPATAPPPGPPAAQPAPVLLPANPRAAKVIPDRSACVGGVIKKKEQSSTFLLQHVFANTCSPTRVCPHVYSKAMTRSTYTILASQCKYF